MLRLSAPKVRALLPDVITYNCAIGTCNAAGKWDLALQVFTSFPDKTEAGPDGSTFTELAGALEKANQWRLSLEILSIALSRSVVPDGTFAGSIAGAVAAACGEGSGMSLLREMLKKWLADVCIEDLADQKLAQDLAQEKERLERRGVEVLERRPGVLVLMKPSGISTETMMELAFGKSWSRNVQTVSRLLFVSTKFHKCWSGKNHNIVNTRRI